MLNRHLPFGALFALACLLPPGNTTHAASFTVNVSNGYPPAPPTEWNPRADDGLIAVISKSTDVFYIHSYYEYYSSGPKLFTEIHLGSARAAAYGSDTSGTGLEPPGLSELYAIEPMADAMATARRTCTLDGAPISCREHEITWANASASVNHRIVQRGTPDIPPGIQGIIDALPKVQVVLDYKLSASATNPDPPYASLASASVSVMQGSTLLFSRKTCASSATISNCTSVGEESDKWKYELEPSTVDRIVTYNIIAGAGAWADMRQVNSVEAQAVADPFLYLDPDWEYAPYFMVQQESLLHPGEWVEVTRIWQHPIPEPQTWALLLAGLGMVGLAVSRRG